MEWCWSEDQSMTKFNHSSRTNHSLSSAVDLYQSGGGAKLVDHIVNALLDAGVERIFLIGTYEERFFYDYCHKRSIEAERQIK
jgi:N-acetylglutamate synthase-like GNAT family acetyltransferase